MDQELTAEQQLEALRAENAALKQKLTKSRSSNLKLKVSEKRGVSLYGINARFPATHYAPQWLKILDMGQDIRDFIEEHKGELSWEKDAQ
jgi:hypothetical protein